MNSTENTKNYFATFPFVVSSFFVLCSKQQVRQQEERNERDLINILVRHSELFLFLISFAINFSFITLPLRLHIYVFLLYAMCNMSSITFIKFHMPMLKESRSFITALYFIMHIFLWAIIIIASLCCGFN